jgi:hypothetical protein
MSAFLNNYPITQRRSKMSAVKNVACTYPGCDKQFFHLKNLKRHAKEKHPEWRALSQHPSTDSILSSHADWPVGEEESITSGVDYRTLEHNPNPPNSAHSMLSDHGSTGNVSNAPTSTDP